MLCPLCFPGLALRGPPLWMLCDLEPPESFIPLHPCNMQIGAHTLQNQCCTSDSFPEGLLENVSGTDHLLPRIELTDTEQPRPCSFAPLPCSLRVQTAAGLQQYPFGSRAVQTVGIGEQMALLAAAPGSLTILGAASTWHEM